MAKYERVTVLSAPRDSTGLQSVVTQGRKRWSCKEPLTVQTATAYLSLAAASQLMSALVVPAWYYSYP